MDAVINSLLSVVVVSLVSLIGVFTIFFRLSTDKWLLFLISLSAGTLFGDAFIHLLPEAVEESGFDMNLSLLVLTGLVLFFIIEKFIHSHHDKKHKGISQEIHGHAYHLGPLNLIGDGFHNFLDGIVIAASYLVSIPVGVATTIAVIFHEIPQEIADFGILIYAGYSKKKALFMNLLSGVAAIAGAIVGLAIGSSSTSVVKIFIAIAAGGFIYIAGSNLIPQLHRSRGIKTGIIQITGILIGIGLMYALTYFE